MGEYYLDCAAPPDFLKLAFPLEDDLRCVSQFTHSDNLNLPLNLMMLPPCFHCYGLDPPLYHLLAKHLGGRREQCESMGRARSSDLPLSYPGSTDLCRCFTVGNAGSRCHPFVIVSIS